MLTYHQRQPQNASWIELNSTAFKHNVTIYKEMTKNHALLGCVLKGNAYGHGFLEMLTLVYKNPIDIIFVINPHDAFYIRAFEKNHSYLPKRIIILGPLMPTEMVECVKHNIEISFGDEHFRERDYFGYLKKIQAEQKNVTPLKIHIHVDTGLGREGVRLEHLDHVLSLFKEAKNLIDIQGVMSHFSDVEDVTEQSYAHIQLDAFEAAYSKIVDVLELKHKPEKHIAQSAATLIMPTYQYDIVRVGISLYGFWPSAETKISARVLMPDIPHLMPVLSWKTKSQAVRELSAGSYIGYGCSYRADRDVRVAVLPVGYYDGYPRSLSNLGHVLVNGKRCKILGRVMMNYCIVDVTEATHHTAPIEATLLGQDGTEHISAEMIADWADTIHYEIVTRIGAHLKRNIT